MSQCAVDGCSAEVDVRKHGLCRMHYQRQRREGLIRTSPAGLTTTGGGWPTRCAVKDCPYGGRLAKGYCQLHYHRWRTYGDPLYVRPKPEGPSARIPEGMTSPTKIAKVLGLTRQRAGQLLHMEKKAARRAVEVAIANGSIAAPPFCLRCGVETKGLHAHHWDYARPLDIGWFCPKCHAAVHVRIKQDEKKIHARLLR